MTIKTGVVRVPFGKGVKPDGGLLVAALNSPDRRAAISMAVDCQYFDQQDSGEHHALDIYMQFSVDTGHKELVIKCSGGALATSLEVTLQKPNACWPWSGKERPVSIPLDSAKMYDEDGYISLICTIVLKRKNLQNFVKQQRGTSENSTGVIILSRAGRSYPVDPKSGLGVVQGPSGSQDPEQPRFQAHLYQAGEEVAQVYQGEREGGHNEMQNNPGGQEQRPWSLDAVHGSGSRSSPDLSAFVQREEQEVHYTIFIVFF